MMRSRVIMCALSMAMVAEPARACSKVPYMMYRNRGVVFFIGAARADTVLTGPGRVKVGPGSPGEPVRSDQVYGQIVRVSRTAFDAATRTRTAFEGDSLDVVFVPWGFGSDCATQRYGGSARWVTTNTRGLFSGVLRDRSDWINDRPTIDVHDPGSVPYTAVKSARYARDTTTLMTPDELLTVYNVLPEITSSITGTAAAQQAQLDPLFRWASGHPALSQREPARGILRVAHWNMVHARLRETAFPLAGTYRFTVTLGSGNAVTFLARTEAHPLSAMTQLSARDSETAGPDGAPITLGYDVVTQVAYTLDGFSAVNIRTEAGMMAQGYLSLVMRPLSVARDSTVWRGGADLVGAAKHMVTDVTLRAELTEASRVMMEMLDSNQLGFADGRFVSLPNGDVRYASTVTKDGQVLVAIRGERISLAVLPPR